MVMINVDYDVDEKNDHGDNYLTDFVVFSLFFVGGNGDKKILIITGQMFSFPELQQVTYSLLSWC